MIGEGSVEGSNESVDSVNMLNIEVASLTATTDSVTTMVAAKEEVKQGVADDLNSTHSTPCEWFVYHDINIYKVQTHLKFDFSNFLWAKLESPHDQIRLKTSTFNLDLRFKIQA